MIPTSRKYLLASAMTALLTVAGLAAADRRIESRDPKAVSQPVAFENFEPRRLALEGRVACLLPAFGAAETRECVLGLRTDDDARYALDFSLMSAIPQLYRVGDRVSGFGTFTPIERLSSDHWRRYGIRGIFSVTDGFNVLY